MEAAFGAYGKVPALGDFVRFGVSQAFLADWDKWLQTCMATLKEQMAEAWTDCYLSAPIWRFSLPGGLAGAAPVLGVLMPSVDRVGRQFPLTLCGPVDPDADLHMTHAAAQPVFEALEDVALGALEDGITSQTLGETLAGVPALVPVARVGSMSLAGGDAFIAPSDPHVGLAALCKSFEGRSLWSCVLEGETRILYVSGLPDIETAGALFDMNAAVWAGREGKETDR